MAYNFFINKGATLPTLRMEAINDGRHDFSKLNIALQAADVYFNMTNIENGIRKIANQKANVIMKEDDGCEDKYIIEYQWKERDTKTPGLYKGEFRIVFNDTVEVGGKTLPIGELIVPISQELHIHIIEGNIKK
jgi:hypothetical protein